MTLIATFACLVFIYVLFTLDRDDKSRPSRALWVPVIWFLIVGTRNVSSWLLALGLLNGPRVTSSEYLEGSPLDRNIYLGLIVLGLITLLRRVPEVRRLMRGNFWIAAFFAYAAVSVTWSDFPDVAFKRWIKALGDLVMILVVLTDPNRLAAIKRLLARVAFVLLPLSILFMKYYPEIGRDYSNSFVWMYRGVADHKNSLGTLCLICGLATLWRLAEAHRDRDHPGRRRVFFAHAAILVCVMYLFVAADSKTSLATFLLAGGLLVAIQASAFFQKRWVLHLVMIGVPASVFVALFLDSSGIMLEALGRDSTLTGRTETWALVLGMAAKGNTLLGAGFESFWLGSRLESLWQTRFEGLNQAHNGYIEVYLNLGWIGLALLLGILISGYRRLLENLSRDSLLGGLWLAFFLSAVLVNIAEAQFKSLTTIWAVLLLGIMASAKGQEMPVGVRAQKPVGRLRDVRYPSAPRSPGARAAAAISARR